MEYLDESLSLYQSLNDTKNITKSYRNKGSIFYRQGRFEEAIVAYEHVASLASMDKASSKDLMVLYSNLAAVNFSLNLQEKSLEYLTKAENENLKVLSKDANNTHFIKILSGIYYNKAIYYYESGDQDLFLEYLQKSIGVLEDIYAPVELYPSLRKLHEYYNKKGDLKKSYELLWQLQQVRDSIFNMENTRQIANLEIQQQLFKEQQEHEKQKR